MVETNAVQNPNEIHFDLLKIADEMAAPADYLLKGHPVILYSDVPANPASLVKVYDEGRTTDDLYSVPFNKLKPKPVKKETDVQQALKNDPEAMEMFAQSFKGNGGRIEVTTSPSVAEKAYADLSSVSSLSEIEAVDYIRVATDRTHGTKFDILVKDNFPPGLAERLGVFFHASGLRARPGEVQINSRPLAEWLMKVHDVLPVKVYDDKHPAPVTPSAQPTLL